MLDVLLGAAVDWIQKNPSHVAYGAQQLFNSAKKSYDSNKRHQEWVAGSEERARRKPQYSAILREFYAEQVAGVIQELKADPRVCGLSEQTIRQFAEKKFADTLEARANEAKTKLNHLKSLFSKESEQSESDDRLRSVWASAPSSCDEYANTFAEILTSGREDDFSKMLLMEKANNLHLNDSQIECVETVLRRFGGNVHRVSQFFEEGDAKAQELENLNREIVATQRAYDIFQYWVGESSIKLEADGDENWLLSGEDYNLGENDSEIPAEEVADEDDCESENTIYFDDAGTNKIAVIKIIRDYTGMGLKDAKDFVDSIPCSLSDIDNAEEMVQDLLAAGAEVRYVSRL